MAIAGIAALLFMSLPYAVVPLRKSLGLETHQWDADPATSHVRVLAKRGAAAAPPFPSPPFSTSPRFRAALPAAAPFSRGVGSRDASRLGRV